MSHRDRRDRDRDSKDYDRLSRPPNSSLYVRNIPDYARVDELRELFGKYGPLQDVYLPLDYYTRRPRGFAYVQFEDERDADDALTYLDKSKFLGRELEVDFARGNRKTPQQMRGREVRSRHDSSYSRSSRYSRRRSYSRSRSRSKRRSRSPRRVSRSPHRSRSPVGQRVERTRRTRSRTGSPQQRSISPRGSPIIRSDGRSSAIRSNRSHSPYPD